MNLNSGGVNRNSPGFAGRRGIFFDQDALKDLAGRVFRELRSDFDFPGDLVVGQMLTQINDDVMLRH